MNCKKINALANCYYMWTNNHSNKGTRADDNNFFANRFVFPSVKSLYWDVAQSVSIKNVFTRPFQQKILYGTKQTKT